ncbi:2-polyprenylphenol 6-hydroxylase [Neomegalonema perideroedes]|uniref:2-polyprenylphenol 6-hydroxylase n=1 Tax=Neomegalonema perideroedes TaxID=217219 RepID=UPI0003635187|nr:2-polyprenylphenol 6-hydroxylase [Neomegalonema perideroedes]
MSWLSAPRHAWRLLQILGAMARAEAFGPVLDEAGFKGKRRKAADLALKATTPFGPKGDPEEAPLVRALTSLGPPAIKFGQMLATRPDIVGPETAASLAPLQDSLPPFPQEEAVAVIEAEFGRPIGEIFSEFGPALAAASIAQVHQARLPDGRPVAVKVLRPGIEALFRRDIDAFTFGARWLERISPDSRRLRPLAAVANFDETTRLELDLRIEAASASEFAENAAAEGKMRAPAIHWSRTSRRVLTMEWIEGTPARDLAALRARGVDMAYLAEAVIQSFLRQALHDGFFHADMHQGNLRVDPQGRLVALDFGIMGRLDQMTRRFYAEILISFLKRDYHRAARVHREAGYISEDADLGAFAQALRAVGEPIFGLGAENISMGRLLNQLFEVTQQFGMETQPQLILLQKTMIMVEGVARSFDPHMNMWQAAQPVAENWMREQFSPPAVARDLAGTLRALSLLGPRLPEIAERFAREAAEPPAKPAPPRRPALEWLAAAALGGGLVALGGWVF